MMKKRLPATARLLRWLRDHSEFGRALKGARIRAGLGVRELAREVGVSFATVSRAEAGRHAMVTTRFEPLATWLLATRCA